MTDNNFLKNQAYINGEWVSADNGQTFTVTNPADHSEITQVASVGKAETQRAIELAEQAFRLWRKRTAQERSQLLRRWYELIMENQEALAQLLSLEQGKPLAESRGEIVYGASFIEWFAEEAKRVYGDVIPAHAPDRRFVVIKQPIGVVAAITPWNFPNAMITRKCAPAMAAGCTVVIKPAPDTPLSALALAALADEAGIPPGVFNVLPTDNAVEVGAELTGNPIVRKLSFTGSTAVGKLLMAQCAGTVKKVSLELGGNAPFLVFDDADLDAAVAGALASKYRNSGQTCVCTNRFLIQEGIYDAFAEKLTQAVEALQVGPALTGESQQGPLINQAAVDKVQRHVDDAVNKGARLMTGGGLHKLGGTFYQPTILADVTAEMRIACEETFGPVAPLFKFKTEQEAINLANDTPFGLASYFYARDIGRVWRVAEALETGMVGINEGIISTAVAPFGGIKESGIGREGSRYGMDDFIEMKYLCMGGLGTD
ncbi:NAD-dependent succinate-semialdehyde dehydrogenase [Sedimenticola sp.]|uniref:NAD-dependent succinate-semialdehyde dehydrogenase n=1 Tax=Sedimenticola sp. TaxID=1940285 RepID=UPI003D0BAD3B